MAKKRKRQVDAFAPLFGDGKGHTGATFPNPNQIVGKAAPAPAPTAGGTTSGAVTASKDEPEEARLDELEDQMKSGLDGLNDGLDLLNRLVAQPDVMPVVDDPDDDPNRNPMIMDDVDPLDSIAYEPDVTAAGMYSMSDFDAINADLDAMDDEDLDLEDPSADDVLGAVLILLNAAMGF